MPGKKRKYKIIKLGSFVRVQCNHTVFRGRCGKVAEIGTKIMGNREVIEWVLVYFGELEMTLRAQDVRVWSGRCLKCAPLDLTQLEGESR